MAASPGSIARAPTDGQLRLITKVARMYHERGIRQTDIAETLHLSQARARRIGIAGGESKHSAIHAAVIGGWVNVLVTDTGTAAVLERKAGIAPGKDDHAED